MNDTIVRHLVAFIATLVVGLAYYAGYISGGYGWWWTVFAILIVYGIMYQIVNADGSGKH